MLLSTQLDFCIPKIRISKKKTMKMAEEWFFCGIRLGICKTYGVLTGYIS
jgi:hypothetical protein